jgi:hypothetical protein
VIVRGIPKVGVIYITDNALLKAVPQEEKVRHFTACQTLYKTDEDVEIVDVSKIELPADSK